MSSDSQTADLAASTANQRDEDEEGKIWFTPPLYRQRYEKVYDILLAENVSSVADLGCSECRALRVFRGLPSVERLIGVDIDRLVLCDKIESLKPLNIDYLMRRSRPLKIQLFLGNILQFDERLAGIEAVSMIEVIEHLTFEDLEKLPAALFGILQPRIVILTTPNAEYNVLFPNLVGFRHADHKFEWTRSQFSNWCSRVASEYGYTVEYDGVGDPPADRASLGCCSQLAVFRHSRFLSEASESRVESYLPYELVGEVEYPVKIKTTTVEEDILNEAIYCMNFLSRRDDNLDDDESSSSSLYDSQHKCIKLEELRLFSQLHTDVAADYIAKLREVLSEAGYKLTNDGLSVICPLDENDHSSSSSLDCCDEDINKPNSLDLHYNNKEEDNLHVPTEDWDI